MMKCNVGQRESQLRVAFGSGLLLTALFAPVPRGLRLLLGAWSIAQLSSGLTRYCPSNEWFGINNCQPEPGKKFFAILQ
jgi:hypothetical protein